MLGIKLCIVFLFANLIDTETARILAYYPTPSISHQIAFRPITLELIKRGHEVTVITTDPMFVSETKPANLTEIDLHDVSYEVIRKFNVTTGKKSDLINQVSAIKDFGIDLLQAQYKQKALQAFVKNHTKEFDLLLVESFIVPALGIRYIIEAPTIMISSFGAFPGNYEMIGAPTHPTIYHNYFRQRLYNLSLWEKLNELLNYLQIKYIISSNEERENELLRDLFGSDIPSLNVLRNSVDMLFLNINPIWEGNYPMPPNVIHLGGLHQKPEKALPKDLQQYLDSSKNGVIYFSFGTNIRLSLLPPEKIAIFVKVFSQLPYNVIWKCDNDDFVLKSDNIKTFKWVPQSDLLRHPNVKLFITQGGLQSTDEAITAGVPLIGVPMLSDQWYNVEKYVHHGIGIRLDMENLTEELLKNAIIEVAEDDTYRKNIVRLRSLIQDQPQTPLQRALWWIEYVLRHGGAKHLRAPTANMSWAEFLELELISVISIGTFIFTIIIIWLYRSVFSKVLKSYLGSEKIKKS